MYLKSIHFNGFKSFADKCDITMTEGITGIVGPNGAGKSNIGDAIRWVLGEQSAKQLRGDAMTDIIFKGTETRRQKAFCEVSLLFDNVTAEVLPDCTEIEVGRKLYRSGESEYLLNGKTCRLRDILELFRGTGIGREGYSIIGQGMIDNILNERSENRRRVFEDAAGIMKYRVRKDEAERKLDRTDQNLLRIADILAEIEMQIDPLREQSEAAKRFFALHERQRWLDANIFLYTVDRGRERIEKLSHDIEATAEAIEAKNVEIIHIDDTYYTNRQRLAEFDAKLSALNETIATLAAETERKTGDMRLFDVRRANLIERGEKLAEAIESDEQAIAGIDDSLKFLSDTEAALAAALTGQYAKRDALSEQIREAAKVAGLSGRSIEEIQDTLFTLLTDLSGVQADIASLTSTIDSASVNERDAKEQLAKIDEETRLHESQRAELAASLSDAAERRKQLLSAANERTAGLTELGDKHDALVEQRNAQQKKLNDAQSRAELLSAMEKSYEGYFDGVKALLKLRDSGDATGKLTLCTVSHAIKSDARYEAAIEAVLGAALQNIIVQRDEDAKKLISVLRRENAGKATFLPLDDLNVRDIEQNERRLLSAPGVCGVASELIGCNKKFANAIRFLLGRTVIVEDMDVAIALMRECNRSLRTVTLSGDVINPGGVITGGSARKNGLGLLSRERMIEQCKKDIAAAAEAIGSTEKSISDVRAKIADAEAARKQCFDDIHEQDLVLTTLRERSENYEREASETAARREALTAAMTDSGASMNKLRVELDKLTIKRDALQSLQLEKNTALHELQNESEGHSGTVDSLREQLSQLNVAITAAEKDVEAKRSEAARLSSERGERKQRITETRAEIAAIDERIAGMGEGTDGIAAEIEALKTKQQDTVSERESVEAAKLTLSEEIADKNKFTARLNAELTELSERKIRAEMNIERIKSESEMSQNKLWEDYQLTYSNAETMREQISITAAREEADGIREQIRELGPINPNSVEDYGHMCERRDYLTEQSVDLQKAKDDLYHVIDELTGKMEDTFVSRFELINKYFGETFTGLFGGGRAEVRLSDDRDIMECGIDIIAEPPGKKLQNITLLSGGEKAMTAIALLFAMQKLNPSPVCVLDEIDAPLDDSNLAMYLKYIREYSKNVQFVVITHKKGAMAMCDSLYGIAMEEKGVSKLVSVRLEQ